MAFPTISATPLDTFDRADSPNLGANWTANQTNQGLISPAIVSNAAAVGVSAGDYYEAYWNPATFGADVEHYLTVTTKGTGGSPSMWMQARLQSPGGAGVDGYEIDHFFATGVWNIVRIVNGAFSSVLATGTQALTNGDKIGVEVAGSGGTVTINGYRFTAGAWVPTPIVTFADTDANRIVAAGNVGFGLHDSNQVVALNDFTAGTTVIPVPPATNPPTPAPPTIYGRGAA